MKSTLGRSFASITVTSKLQYSGNRLFLSNLISKIESFSSSSETSLVGSRWILTCKRHFSSFVVDFKSIHESKSVVSSGISVNGNSHSATILSLSSSSWWSFNCILKIVEYLASVWKLKVWSQVGWRLPILTQVLSIRFRPLICSVV